MDQQAAMAAWDAASPGPRLGAEDIRLTYYRFAHKMRREGEQVRASLLEINAECWESAEGLIGPCVCPEGRREHDEGAPCKGAASVHVYAQLIGGRRRAEDVTAVTALFFDFDGHQDYRPLVRALQDLGICHLWQESSSSRPGCRKWHIVLPIAQPVIFPAGGHAASYIEWWGKTAYKAAAEALCALGGLQLGEWDRSCSSVPRVRYVGTRLSEDAAPRQLRTQAGRLVDWRALLAALNVPAWAPPQQEDASPTRKRKAAPAADGWDGGRTQGHTTGSLVVHALSAMGLLGSELSPGKYATLCPWRDEHSSGRQAEGQHDSSTVAYTANGGGYMCLHSHCEGRRAGDVLRYAREVLPHGVLPDRPEWGGEDTRSEDERLIAAGWAPRKKFEPSVAPTTEGSDANKNKESVTMNQARCKDNQQQVTPIDAKARGRWIHLPAAISAKLDRKPKSGGKLRATTSNVIMILSHDERWQGVLAWDEFSVKMMKQSAPPWHDDLQGSDAGPGEWSKSDTSRLIAWMEREYEITLGRDTLGACAAVVARAHTVHPVREYLQGLRWDGVPRLGTWLCDLLGAEQSRYTELVGQFWAVSAVARIFKPGVKVDTMMILEGDQGKGKGQTLRALSEPWFSDSEIQWQSKDKYQQIQGVWVYEIAEMAGMGKHDEGLLKAFLSSQTDRFRAPYDDVARDWPRSVCFGGSYNPDLAKKGTYLRDSTGGRRYWPVRCFINKPRADIALAKQIRDQLWAEAVHLYRQGAQWWPSVEDEHLFVAQQEERSTERQDGAWDATIAAWLAGQAPTIAQTWDRLVADGVETPLLPGVVLTSVIGMPLDRQTASSLREVGAVFRRLGWVPMQRQASIGGVKCFPFVPQLGVQAMQEWVRAIPAPVREEAIRMLLGGPITRERMEAGLAAAQRWYAQLHPQPELPGVSD